MKANYLSIALLSVGLFKLSACGQTTDQVVMEENGIKTESEILSKGSSLTSQIDQFPIGNLSDNEAKGLQFLREEEKLARDVYLTLYSQWSLLPFKNISSSEQVHMDAILNLLNRYEIDDPAEGNEVGMFTNGELQELYNQLIERGAESEIEALKVGALIEEVDIADIQRMLDDDVQSEDIEFVLNNLKRASGNHLKAFVRNLNRRNVNYTPVVLDALIFNEIAH